MKHHDVLSKLIKDNDCKKIAEIGVFKGKCFRNILRIHQFSIDEYWAIDRYQSYNNPSFSMGRLTQNDWDKIYLRNCLDMKYFKCFKNVKASSEEATTLFSENYFDLVFIDADHDKISVIKDITLWKPLIKNGGILSGHDYGKGASKGHDVKSAVHYFFNKVNLEKDGVWWIKL